MEIQSINDAGVSRAEVAAFMARLNDLPEHRIGYCDETPAAVLSSFEEIRPRVEEGFFVARLGGRLAGAFGFDADSDLGRAWLWGPFIEHDRWSEVANELWEAVAGRLPTFVREVEMFYDVHNRNCDRFARARGFSVVKDDVSILQLHRDRAPASAHADPLTAALQGPVADLHDRLFPNTFLPSSRMLKAFDDTHRTLVIADGGRLLGYAHGHIDTDAAIGSLEYVGVVETARDRGIGTRLVRAFCAWAFSFEAIREVALTVDRDNEAARHVYAKLGFEHLFDARGARRAWPGLAAGIT